jgi:hypothetical protein
MNAQTQTEGKERKLYATGAKEAARLDKDHGAQAAVIHKAYEAAVAELGLSDKELMDAGNARKVAKLMFSSKYLGNAKFNPLLKGELYKDFDKQGEIEQGRLYDHMLGVNLDTFVRSGGIIDTHSGLRRGSLTEAVERHYNGQTVRQLMALAWQKAYDPEKGLQENMASYVKALQDDPILSGSGAKIDAGKFDSIDDAAQVLATSLMGRSSREMYQNRYGAKFN